MTREYPVKKSVKLSSDFILEVVKSFSDDARIDGDHVICSIPGLSVIDFTISSKKLVVGTESAKDNPDPMKTVKQFNQMIEKITGYSVKERKKIMSKL
ncbi:MAG: DUF5611 family protein [Thermoplasmatales archaeon]|nr:DUF5611 family protein [Thermoplasmatales archaeon]MCW6171177.1 DUF5611 family protein [Thermoplasmatales archaeon]